MLEYKMSFFFSLNRMLQDYRTQQCITLHLPRYTILFTLAFTLVMTKRTPRFPTQEIWRWTQSETKQQNQNIFSMQRLHSHHSTCTTTKIHIHFAIEILASLLWVLARRKWASRVVRRRSQLFNLEQRSYENWLSSDQLASFFIVHNL